MGVKHKTYFKCDRCGVEQEAEGLSLDINYKVRLAYKNYCCDREEFIWLCPKCRKDFVKFMGGRLKEDEW